MRVNKLTRRRNELRSKRNGTKQRKKKKRKKGVGKKGKKRGEAKIEE